MSSVVSPRSAAQGLWSRVPDLILPVLMIASILLIMWPLPSVVMDLLLSANITIAVVMLLTTIYVRTPLEFNIFPSLLLATTLFRLVLNVATTRLILTHAGSDGELAAGGVVQAFGRFVTGGAAGNDNIVVGLIIFTIIVVIQFVVITKGATRISEVAARFTLDGMPGKQMAIDADVAAGLIDQQEAQRRRQQISQQADFFGAMDGASKFVRGDAIAGIVIILINIIGGLFIGVVKMGMDVGESASLFTTLTIGDGLVTQVPAFLISLAAALLVTRSSQESNLPKDFLRQLLSRPQVLGVAGVFLAVLMLTGLPRMPLLLIGAGCIAIAWTVSRRESKHRIAVTAKKHADATKTEPRVEDYLAIDPMELELGIGLIRLADRKRGGNLLERIGRVRQSLAAEMGILLPKVRIRDNMRLDQHQYQIKIADMAVAQGTIDVKSPDPAGEISSQLNEAVRRHADELLSRDAVKHLLDQLRQTSPATVDELIPGVMKLGEVQQVLQLLLREAVPIRQLGTILEALGDYASRTKEPAALAEHVRQRLARTICTRYRDHSGLLHVVTLDPAIEERLRDGAEFDGDEVATRLSPQDAATICERMAIELEKLDSAGRPPIVLVSPHIRRMVRQLLAAPLPQAIILSYGEITRDTSIHAVGMVADVAEDEGHLAHNHAA